MVQRSTSPAGPTARTTLRTAAGRIECWDGLVGGEDGRPHLVRLVRTDDSALDVTHELALGGFVLAITGRLDEARRRADAPCAALPRLMAEEVDPESGAALGNVPLVWSHIEAARAVYILDAAEVRRRYRAAERRAWRIGRYLRLRWGRR